MLAAAQLPSHNLRRLAGAGALAHVVTFLVAAVIIGQPTVHEGQEGIEHSLVDRGLWPAYAGMYVLTIGFLALLPTMVFLSHSLGRRTQAGSWAAQTGLTAGAGAVFIIVGVGFSAGAAALWGLDHGLDLDTVIAVNNVRNFSYFVVTPMMGAYAIATGFAALTDGTLTRWTGWGGVAVGAALMLAVPAAAVGVQYAMPLWLLWWVGLGISLVRTPQEPDTSEPTDQQTERVTLGEDQRAR